MLTDVESVGLSVSQYYSLQNIHVNKLVYFQLE